MVHSGATSSESNTDALLNNDVLFKKTNNAHHFLATDNSPLCQQPPQQSDGTTRTDYTIKNIDPFWHSLGLGWIAP
jgi:hypothetical protein